jgi:hypothetical protein
MYQCVIIYAPEDKTLQGVINNIKALVDKNLFTLTVMPAGKALISHIALADLVILASLNDSGLSIHEDFSELLRTFTGVNLSGKLVGFVTAKDGSSLRDFEKSLKDTGITYFEEPLAVEDGSQAGSRSLTAWIKKMENEFKEFKSVHKF